MTKNKHGVTPINKKVSDCYSQFGWGLSDVATWDQKQ
jgi:hypothetical protein